MSSVIAEKTAFSVASCAILVTNDPAGARCHHEPVIIFNIYTTGGADTGTMSPTITTADPHNSNSNNNNNQAVICIFLGSLATHGIMASCPGRDQGDEYS